MLLYYSPGPTIGFVPDSYNVNEDDGFVEFNVEVIRGTLERDIEVTFTTQPGTATEDGESCDQSYIVTALSHVTRVI